jgi:hypothetical protein
VANEVDLTSDQVRYCGCSATIWHERKLCPGFFMKKCGYKANVGYMDRGRSFAWIGLEPINQFVQVPRRHRFPRNEDK